MSLNTEEKQSNYIVSTLVHALFENKKYTEEQQFEILGVLYYRLDHDEYNSFIEERFDKSMLSTIFS